MTLEGFSVSDFRSVKVSNWIATDTVTALIGTNESGKTNILVPLWKFNPASEGRLEPIQDYPRNRYNEFRSLEEKPVFIKVKFSLTDAEARKVADITKMELQAFKELVVEMDYDSNKYISFPMCHLKRDFEKAKLLELLEKSTVKIEASEASKQEEPLKEEILRIVRAVTSSVSAVDRPVVIRTEIAGWQTSLSSVSLERTVKTSVLKPVFEQLLESLQSLQEGLNKKDPASIPEVESFVLGQIPSFVYYSNYGNLDSEIYLPHVIANLQREDLGAKEAAKARTLRVLFEFVRLSPQEIHDLGKDTFNGRPPQNQTEIDEVAKRKKERDILLQSASTELTQKFRDWWKQGEYRFRFQADGDHFRIWVSDEKRPEDIELEGRSTGLQWFLSFFLVFLVESKKKHLNSILLLDEPGLSLHPMAQKDLALFFENLARTNQILYTTHSPFLIDTDKLDRVRSVYIDDGGYTEVSPDLRASQGKVQQQKSIFPVHAALGLSVSDTLLLGSIPVIVEGQSDQNYLTVIKSWLIRNKLINPMKEFVFIPAGGVKGIKALLPIITGVSEALPYVIVDSDGPGQKQYKELTEGLYSSEKTKVIQVGQLITVPNAEVEDFFPTPILVEVFDKIYRVPDFYLSDTVADGSAIVEQMEAYSKQHGLVLETPGWKVVVSKHVKLRILNRPELVAQDSPVAKIWRSLFELLLK